MKPIDSVRDIYHMSVNFIVGVKRGSGTVLTLEDIANALKNQGCQVKLSQSVGDKTPTLFVIPLRHLLTGEDAALELEETGFLQVEFQEDACNHEMQLDEDCPNCQAWIRKYKHG